METDKSMPAPELALWKDDRSSSVEEMEALGMEITQRRFVNRILKDT